MNTNNTRKVFKTIYFDMDGVMCDFDGDFKRVMKKPIKEATRSEIDLYLIHGVMLEGLFTRLKPRRDFSNLKSYMKQLALAGYDVRILSACGCPMKDPVTASKYFNMASDQKKRWLVKNGLPYKPTFVKTGVDKKNYAKVDSLLVDDMADNVKAFKSRGGEAILFTNYNDFAKEVANLL